MLQRPSAALVPSSTSHLSISIGVAQHGLVVGGLELRLRFCGVLFFSSGRCAGFDSARGAVAWIWGNVRDGRGSVWAV